MYFEVALHLAADDLAEALVVAFDFLPHGESPPRGDKVTR